MATIVTVSSSSALPVNASGAPTSPTTPPSSLPNSTGPTGSGSPAPSQLSSLPSGPTNPAASSSEVSTSRINASEPSASASYPINSLPTSSGPSAAPASSSGYPASYPSPVTGPSSTAPESSPPAVTSPSLLTPTPYGIPDTEQTSVPSNGSSSSPTGEPSNSIVGPSDLPTASGPSVVSSTSPVTGNSGSSASSSGSPSISGIPSGGPLPSGSAYPASSLEPSGPSNTTSGPFSSSASAGYAVTSPGTVIIPSSTFSTSTVSSGAGGNGGYSYPASYPYGDLSSPAPDSLPTDSACDNWVGVEVIILVDEFEICPDGETNLVTVTVTSNVARPDPEPTLAVQQCATCERAVVRMAVEGHTPGTECLGCVSSTSDYLSTAMLTLSDVETISLGSYSLGSYPAASTSTGIAASTGYEASNGPESVPGPIITPTPFASAPEPSSNTLYSPPPTNSTYVTAGSARSEAGAAVFGFVTLVMMAMLAQ
ncbi:hypothetical protein N0V82_010275 [Gnomoniopsis sp. IMI 355080]|nr:hypothetical protein N0V82_010275 [Gnomoniopsis sp. IMI 355080]